MFLTATVTDIPAQAYRRSAMIETSIPKECSKSAPAIDSYFILTGSQAFGKSLPEYFTVSDTYIVFRDYIKMEPQFDFMSVSKSLYENSVPLEGEDLNVLNKTFKRLLSRTPTKL